MDELLDAGVDEVKAKVRRILESGEAGQRELLADLKEGLITAMYLEMEAGENPKEAGNYTEGNARQSRKQFKELAEMVLKLMEGLR